MNTWSDNKEVFLKIVYDNRIISNQEET